jgi:hypothetical protein
VQNVDKFMLYNTDTVQKWKLFPGALRRVTGEIYWQSGTLIHGFEITRYGRKQRKKTV